MALPLLAGGCCFPQGAPTTDALFQVAPLHNLLAGAYDGLISFGRVRAQGDFGLGTLDALDGELLLLDGLFYQVRGDGSVHPVPNETTTPFVMVKHFRDDRMTVLPDGLDLNGIRAVLDREMGAGDPPWAIRLEGRFLRVKTRSVPRQVSPYPPLAEVVKHQSTFEFTEVDGTVVGFRMPAYLQGVNLPGYHFHFLTKRRDRGGHVLALETGAGVVARLDRAEAFHLVPGEMAHKAREAHPGELEWIEGERK